ncbi:MAG: hypothetical protein BZY88_05460 [SAR202 cluster bacterium Io17-Chloro-G9]|nr:MAG: hypothetical protein BZY88_05460 [SAR202 cluster bacterium Io17-Chloro-G9]
MASVITTSADPRNARRYVQVMESLGVDVRLATPGEDGSNATEALMDGIGGFLLPGGPDVDPIHYGESPDPAAALNVNPRLDDLDFRLLECALARDMPVLAICRGMQLLNVATGGRLIQDLPDHRAEHCDGNWVSKKHRIFLSPGSKAAAIIGMAGFFQVNSRHHQGLREAQRSQQLMTTAYSVEDGLIEGLESPEHSWVVGLQCHPERQDEVPRLFANLFAAFQERAELYSGTARSRAYEIPGY